MDNVIILKFEKSLSGLAGYDFGMETYNKQVEGKIDFSKKATLIFPDNIQRIASSFVQGFFEKIIQQIGISGIRDSIIIESSRANMKEKIVNNLM
ncbi:MAG: hypothetical protein KH828_07810 [Clostridiales bacterium]|nr:hypothetical protein [Clostridiales bacterium]